MQPLEEVNFWVPGKSISLPRLQPGELLLFKLHSPNNYIVGGGVYAHGNILPISLAWQAFGPTNGASTYGELRTLIERYRGYEPPNRDYRIGCVALTQPFLWPEDRWVASNEYWKAGSRKYVKYDLSEDSGIKLWNLVQIQSCGNLALAPKDEKHKTRHGKPYLVKPRLGQGGFRMRVADAYSRRCAVTQERVLHVLEAAHIKPYEKSGPHAIGNGVFLRSDIHRLLDSGYVTISPDYHFEVSRRIKEDFDNGEEYRQLHGVQLYLPAKSTDYSSPEFVRWHNMERFKG